MCVCVPADHRFVAARNGGDPGHVDQARVLPLALKRLFAIPLGAPHFFAGVLQ
jgi:hypothetical protein